MKQRTQSGLEYLLTYGWALILISSIVGVMLFTIGGPDEQTAFSSSDPGQLTIKGGTIAEGRVDVKLQNLTGGKIEDIQVTGGDSYSSCDTEASDASTGSEITVSCNASSETEGKIVIEYTNYAGLERTVEIRGRRGNTVSESPEGEQNCNNGLNDDWDDATDCQDIDCDGMIGGQSGELCEYGMEETCDDYFDNDRDGKTDCNDEDCALAPACTPSFYYRGIQCEDDPWSGYEGAEEDAIVAYYLDNYGIQIIDLSFETYMVVSQCRRPKARGYTAIVYPSDGWAMVSTGWREL